MIDLTVIIPIIHNEALPYYWEKAMDAVDSVMYQTKRPQLIVSVEDTLAQAKNSGVAKATTEWCMFLDADDTISTDFIEKCNTPPDEVGILKPVCMLNGKLLPLPASDILQRNFLINGCPFRKSLFEQVGGVREGPFEDWDLWARILIRSNAEIQTFEGVYNYYKTNLGLNYQTTQEDIYMTRQGIRTFFDAEGYSDREEFVPTIHGY